MKAPYKTAAQSAIRAARDRLEDAAIAISNDDGRAAAMALASAGGQIQDAIRAVLQADD